MNLNDAGRLVAVIDNRIRRLIKSEAQVETTWGEVCGISADGMLASAYLYGSSDPSEGFRIPGSLAIAVGDKVKVAWDGRGDRYVVEAANPGPYKKVEINASTGEVLTGDGSSPPTPISGSHDSLTDVSADDHHAKSHGHDGVDGSGVVSHDDLTDVSADDHHTENHQSRHLEGGADELAGALRVQAASGPTKVLSGKRSADANPRWQVTADGTISIFASPGDTHPVFRITAAGVIERGPGGSTAIDTNLYRSASDVLKTDDAFQAASLAIGSNKVARYVPVHNTILSSPVTHTTDQARTSTGEITLLPTSGVVAVNAGVLMRPDSGAISTSNWAFATFLDYGGAETNYPGRGYQAVLDQWSSAHGIYIPGGTNGRELDYILEMGAASAVIVYWYIIGYWTTE